MRDVERPRAADGSGTEPGVHQGLAAGKTERAAEPAAAAASGTAAAQAVRSLSADPAELEFELACAVVYHRAREAWFTLLKRGTMFATILLGTASVAPFVPSVLTGPLVALMGALNLAFDFAGQASRHADLRAAYMKIVASLQGSGFADEACVVARRKMLKLAAKAPPPYCTVQLVAQNQAILSLGRDRRKLEQISRLRSLTRHVWRAEGL